MNSGKRPIRILIVDDMPQVRHELRLVLPLASYDNGSPIQVVGEAGDGQEAVRLAGILHPDAVLMDLAMPRMDGFTATREIKAGNPEIRVIVLSIHTDEDCRTRARLAGADEFLEKGTSLRELTQAVTG